MSERRKRNEERSLTLLITETSSANSGLLKPQREHELDENLMKSSSAAWSTRIGRRNIQPRVKAPAQSRQWLLPPLQSSVHRIKVGELHSLRIQLRGKQETLREAGAIREGEEAAADEQVEVEERNGHVLNGGMLSEKSPHFHLIQTNQSSREAVDKRARNDERQRQSKRRKTDGEEEVLPIYATKFSQEEIAAQERRPKRKVAVMVGYSGSGYKGLQL